MGIAVLVLGESGTGKSCSLRNFKSGEVGIVNVAGKPLPFRSNLTTITKDGYADILTIIGSAKAKSIVIDDAQYVQANELMRRSPEKGFDKWTEIANHLWQLFQAVKSLPDDRIVYFLAHTENNDGKERFKTCGKLMDSYSVEGMATICLKTVVEDGCYYFSTQNNGSDTVKTPMGMFSEPLIDNDLKAVDVAIREYYGIGGE